MKNIIKKKIYLAGPLFSRGQIVQRLEDEIALMKNLQDLKITENAELKISVFNPIKFNTEIDLDNITETTFFEKDFFEIKNSDIMIADLDELDSGTLLELGIFMEMMNYNKDLKCYVIWSNWKEKRISNKFVNGAVLSLSEYHPDMNSVCDSIISYLKNKEMRS